MMAELRWILLALGVMLVCGIYIWGRGVFRRTRQGRSRHRRRNEPRIAADDNPISDDVLFAAPGSKVDRKAAWSTAEPDLDDFPPDDVPATPEPPAAPRIEKVIALRFVPISGELDAVEAVAALQDAGLEHGRYGIFHRHHSPYSDEALFSVASLTEPGSFDLERLDEAPLVGMSFFMILPGIGDPVGRFDTMVETARTLARLLDAELFDDRGTLWSIQRERYIREELISYRAQPGQ